MDMYLSKRNTDKQHPIGDPKRNTSAKATQRARGGHKLKREQTKRQETRRDGDHNNTGRHATSKEAAHTQRTNISVQARNNIKIC